MKKTFTTSILVAALAFAATTVNAKSWRINSDPNQGTDFTSINDAMSSSDVAEGDTLYLDPGCGLGNQTVSKRVTIVGPGYLRSDAPYRSATTGYLYITAANTKIEGLVMNGILYISAQNVTVERCNINSNIIIGYNSTNAQYATIRQCYITSYIEGKDGNTSYCGYSTIENNIIIASRGGTSTYHYGVLYQLPYSTIKNNIIQQTFTSGNSSYGWVISKITGGMITNNVLLNTGKSPNNIITELNNCTTSRNIMSCTETTYTGLGENVYLGSNDESLVFALEGTNDQRYQLKEDSPAKGYATDGGDCGPYGGTYPYVISGLPAGYPYYTKAVIGTRATDGKINVSLNIKMQNE